MSVSRQTEVEPKPEEPRVPKRLRREAIVLAHDRGRIGLLMALCGVAGLAVGFAMGSLTHVTHDRVAPAAQHQSPGWLGVIITTESDGGARVLEVLPDSPAERAGVAVGDVIDTFDGTSVHSAAHLRRLVRASGPGVNVTLNTQGGCHGRTINATLARLPPQFNRWRSRTIRYRN